MQRRLRDIWNITAAVGVPSSPPSPRHRTTEFAALTALFETERQQLSRPPKMAAQTLRGLTLARTHPALAPDQPVSPAEIVSLLLDGVRRETLMLIRLLISHLRPVPADARARRSSCRRCRRWPRCTCRASTPTSSTRASPPATPATSGAIGALMLLVTLVQVGVRGRPPCTSASKAAMGFGRDVRSGLFHQVTGLLGPGGRPVRRAVADHPHHQRRAAGADAGADDVHAAGRRADHRRRRHHHGAARGRRAVVDPARQHPGAGHLRSARHRRGWCRSSG